MEKTAEISDLMDLTENQLAELFAKESHLLGRGMRPPPPTALVSATHAWIKEQVPKLCDSICVNETVRTMCNIPPGKEARLHLAIAVSEAIGHSFIHLPGIPALAVLLVKMGIDKLCEQCWCAKS